MRNLRRCWPVCLVAAAACLMAADPVWKSKPAAQWTEEDARQILTHVTLGERE